MTYLYYHLGLLSPQLSELKAGLSDRSRLLEEIERHLLVQEVTNKLLVADLQRREMEVQYLRDARKKAIIRRWRTYGGTDLMDRRKAKYTSQSLSLICRFCHKLPVVELFGMFHFAVDKTSFEAE